MRRLKTIPVLVALIVGLGVVTVALAAALISDDDEEPEPVTPNTAAQTAAAPSPSPTGTVELEAPDSIPDDLWARLQELPDKLRNDLMDRYEAGAIGIQELETVVEEYENRNQGVRVGTVLEATDSLLRLEVYTTGEQAEVIINEETVIKRANQDIAATDLQADELVMVLSMDGGVTAFSIEAYGVGAP